MRLRSGVLFLALVGFGGAGLLGCGNSGGTGDDLAMAPKADLTMVAPGNDASGDDAGVDLAAGDGPLGTDDGGAIDMSVPQDLVTPISDDMPPLAEDGGGADLTTPPCGNTTQSCGLPGQCLDCTGNTVGTNCVANACGCMTAADCPTGNACDPNTHQCGPGCANGLSCNGGCCDGKNCTQGNANGACGNGGGACAACGSGTPTCQAGSCTANCGLGGMGQAGTCGNGFCCGAGNQCQTIANGACGVAGGACTDCSKSANGPTCLQNGTCGCNAAKDCPSGQACKAGVCGTVCDANTACNGGCCSSGKCVAGNQASACALGSVLCGTCLGNVQQGGACVVVGGKTNCGCNSATDCPVGQACDGTTHACGAACDANTACNGGCCSAAMNGMCQKGTDVMACGSNGGLCGACANNTIGHACVAVTGGGQCGCTGQNGNLGLGDCPIQSTSCDTVKHLCVNSCGDNMKCQAGCCSAHANGTCQTGTGDTTCGGSGICVDCTMASGGHICLPANETCGCSKSSDCSMGNSCDPVSHQCTAKCNVAANQICNGGCCTAGTCAAGTAPTACGTASACVDCTANVAGHACIGGAGCGCNSSADCGALQACDANKHLCTNVCSDNQPCNGGCCLNGICAAGTLNGACGGNGKTCGSCKDGSPTCVKNACAPQCGGPNDGVCGNDNCCSKGKCVTGEASSACGFSGACADCTANSVGTACIVTKNGPNVCGCNDKPDCLQADPQNNIAGYACDKTNHSCTSLCGANGLSLCNGGCCSGPNGTCRSGGLDTSCGNNGAFCSSCQDSCNPGPTCNAMNGSCGCTTNDQCELNIAIGAGSCGPSRMGCNLGSASCCIKGGTASNNANLCCSGAVSNGRCTCVATGQAATGGDPSSCCTLNANNQGVCACRAGCGRNGIQCFASNLCTVQSDCCGGSTCVNLGPYSLCILN